MAEEHATRSIRADERLAISAVELVITAGPGRGERFRVQEGRASLGSGIGASVRLDDESVSRLHCQLVLSRGSVRIVDAESTNGTFVDGVRVRDAFLSAGSLVVLGGTTLRVEVADEPAYLELSQADRFGEVLGSSVAIRRLYAVLERVAATDATLLVRGETGTGKELVARSVHHASERRQGPLVVVDCGAIAGSLIESELFGHVQGAFTGANSDRDGLIAAADGGTLFLDEIGELPLSLQPKLLRVLENRELRRVGANRSSSVDVRVIAATHRPLAERVNEGLFREDLYYRLAVVEVELPPLRARRDDIPLLARHFASDLGADPKLLTREVMGALLARSWPGNVRELRNVVERSVSLGLLGARSVGEGQRDAAEIAGLDALVPTHIPLQEARELWMAEFERAYLRAVMAQADGNVSEAARQAGVNRRFLYRMMKRLGISPSELEP